MRASYKNSSNYFLHIDGLRALAVLAVLLMHLDFSLFSGGYIGVDVFFVISGFLISNILVNELSEDGRLSFLSFYARRVRRILPALLFTLLLTFLVAIWVLNLAQFKVFGGAFSAALLSFSNVFYYHQSGYFDIFSQSSPLLHTWSLGVEAQFYLIWPLYLLVIFKLFEKYLIHFIFFLLLISFALNIYAQHSDPTALYYLTPYRIFEFSIGALMVWGVKLNFKNTYILELIFFAGMLLVCYSIFFFNENTLFPSYNGLIPTVGAALLIYSGKARYAGLLLRNPFSRFIGLISYSLYLVHWPVIVFIKLFNQNSGAVFSMTWEQKIFATVFSICLASLMYRFVERPFRRHNSREKKHYYHLFARWGGFTLGLLFLGVSIFHSKGWLWRAEHPEVGRNIDDITKIHEKNWGGAGFSGDYIYQGNKYAPSIVMLGDSHCGMLDTGMVEKIGKKYKLSLFTASGGGAGKYPSSLLLPGITRIGKDQKSFDDSDKTAYLDAIEKLSTSNKSILLVSASYSTQLNVAGQLSTHKSLNINTETMNKYEQYAAFTRGFDMLKDKLGSHKLVILGDFPGASQYNMTQCATLLKWNRNKRRLSCSEKQLRTSTSQGARNVNRILKEYASRTNNVYFIDPYDYLCSKEACKNVDEQGNPIYSDGSHLSKKGSIFFAEKIRPELMKIIQN